MKYIGETPAANFHAGNKARADIDRIFKSRNYDLVENFYETQFKSIGEKISYIIDPRTWLKIFRTLQTHNENLAMQFPTYSNSLVRWTMNRVLKQNRTLIVVHDVDALRDFSTANSIDQINSATLAIVHNSKMKSELESLGVQIPMIELDLFDYLLDKIPKIERHKSSEIVFAGNLGKSKFLKQNLELNFQLYGIGWDKKFNESYNYYGSFPPDEIPFKLKGSFGLIWDGDSIETCAGSFGKYLRFNNPHKFSLYIASGLPTITWRHAAIADFILRNEIGFVVDSLHEIPRVIENISDDRYSRFLKNLEELQLKVTHGFFTNSALDRAEEILGG